MSNTYRQFSKVCFTQLTIEEKNWLIDKLATFEEYIDFKKLDTDQRDALQDKFTLERNITNDDQVELWPDFEYDLEFREELGNYFAAYSEDYGNLDNVVTIVQQFIKRFRPHELVWIIWVEYDSRTCPDSQDGGAVIITRNKVKWLNCYNWVMNELKKKKRKNL